MKIKKLSVLRASSCTLCYAEYLSSSVFLPVHRMLPLHQAGNIPERLIFGSEILRCLMLILGVKTVNGRRIEMGNASDLKQPVEVRCLPVSAAI